MIVKTSNNQYWLVEFNNYIDHSMENTVSVVDLVVECNDVESIMGEFDDTFIVDTDNLSYIFFGYELIECYAVGGNLIHIVCVK